MEATTSHPMAQPRHHTHRPHPSVHSLASCPISTNAVVVVDYETGTIISASTHALRLLLAPSTDVDAFAFLNSNPHGPSHTSTLVVGQKWSDFVQIVDASTNATAKQNNPQCVLQKLTLCRILPRPISNSPFLPRRRGAAAAGAADAGEKEEDNSGCLYVQACGHRVNEYANTVPTHVLWFMDDVTHVRNLCVAVKVERDEIPPGFAEDEGEEGASTDDAGRSIPRSIPDQRPPETQTIVLRLNCFGRIIQSFPMTSFLGQDTQLLLNRFLMRFIVQEDVPELCRSLSRACRPFGYAVFMVRWTWNTWLEIETHETVKSNPTTEETGTNHNSLGSQETVVNEESDPEKEQEDDVDPETEERLAEIQAYITARVNSRASSFASMSASCSAFAPSAPLSPLPLPLQRHHSTSTISSDMDPLQQLLLSDPSSPNASPGRTTSVTADVDRSTTPTMSSVFASSNTEPRLGHLWTPDRDSTRSRHNSFPWNHDSSRGLVTPPLPPPPRSLSRRQSITELPPGPFLPSPDLRPAVSTQSLSDMKPPQDENAAQQNSTSSQNSSSPSPHISHPPFPPPSTWVHFTVGPCPAPGNESPDPSDMSRHLLCLVQIVKPSPQHSPQPPSSPVGSRSRTSTAEIDNSGANTPRSTDYITSKQARAEQEYFDFEFTRQFQRKMERDSATDASPLPPSPPPSKPDTSIPRHLQKQPHPAQPPDTWRLRILTWTTTATGVVGSAVWIVWKLWSWPLVLMSEVGGMIVKCF
ncbi:uncharacterized protein EV422DRAFT_534850 [Fimicolochytrium jonesii]|uniref:uncharacterized protein n=1 Tax=Fimicolochytrium jonesii TaxID=1396493 RepID=UPI0022FED887|nr:uncharacterized protein EV422DRAFT_534850 [Fimicolochytrium jonesii]KAI8819462.1 hypothetical protein EV422DRAFT_534850 [Fimicolochytrium jonesii]